MDWNSILIVLLMFVLRLGVPIAILFGLGYLYERWSSHRGHPDQPSVIDDRQQPYAAATPVKQGAGYAAQAPPCWEANRCADEDIEECVAAQRPGVPCWLSMQLAEGRLPERCFECEVFNRSMTATKHYHDEQLRT